MLFTNKVLAVLRKNPCRRQAGMDEQREKSLLWPKSQKNLAETSQPSRMAVYALRQIRLMKRTTSTVKPAISR